MTDTWSEAREEQESLERARRGGNPERAARAKRRLRRHRKDLGLTPRQFQRGLEERPGGRSTRARGWDAWDINWNKGWSDDDTY